VAFERAVTSPPVMAQAPVQRIQMQKTQEATSVAEAVQLRNTDFTQEQVHQAARIAVDLATRETFAAPAQMETKLIATGVNRGLARTTSEVAFERAVTRSPLTQPMRDIAIQTASVSPAQARRAQRNNQRNVDFAPIIVDLKMTSPANMQVKRPSVQEVEIKIVITAGAISSWIGSRSTRLNSKEVDRAAEMVAQLSRTQEGRQILGVPAKLESHMKGQKFTSPIIVEVFRVAKELQQPQNSSLPVTKIVKMKTRDAVTDYPAAFGSQVMFRSPTIKLAEANKIVDIFGQMVEKDSGVLDCHSAEIKRELIGTWKMRPGLADAATQVVDSSKGVMEIIVPSRKAIMSQTAEGRESRAKEAVKFVRSSGRNRDADRLQLSVQQGKFDFELNDIASLKDDASRASDMEMDIAIHFLEMIHPDSAEFVKEMATQNRLGSLDLQRYVEMTKINNDWVRMVNRNYVALGDMNQQMKQYERDLSQYRQFGGKQISITDLGDYVRVGNRDMPRDLVSLMAQKPAEPKKLAVAIGARIPSMEPAHLDAIHTLATISPQEIRTAMNKAGKTIGMEQYEVDGMIRELEILRVEAASTEIGASHELIEQERSFLLHMMAANPKAVVWLAQESNPVQPGDLRVASTLIAEKMVAFS
ncbi:MAG: hypothetical protein KAR31_04275, partial [Candidatus Omnitrophica bacterium]|nr:hypothetical protein [Candidatus Omnitrophota bacterium]